MAWIYIGPEIRGKALLRVGLRWILSALQKVILYIIADSENDRVQVWQLSGDMPLPDTADVEKFKKSLHKFEGSAGSAGTTTGTTSTTTTAGGR